MDTLKSGDVVSEGLCSQSDLGLKEVNDASWVCCMFDAFTYANRL